MPRKPRPRSRTPEFREAALDRFEHGLGFGTGESLRSPVGNLLPGAQRSISAVNKRREARAIEKAKKKGQGGF